MHLGPELSGGAGENTALTGKKCRYTKGKADAKEPREEETQVEEKSLTPPLW